MAERTTGFVKVDHPDHGKVEVPYVIQGGEKRLLAAFPTPDDHMMRGLPTWLEAGLPVIDRKDWAPFSRVWDSVPILDQDGKGACLPHAWTTAVMIAVVRSGMDFLDLSPWFLYSLIDRGVDAGSNAGDAVQALISTGICPNAAVPYGTIRPAGYSAAAKSAAADYRLPPDGAVRIQGFDQAVTATILGWTVCLDLCAGAGFDVDAQGVCRVLRGPNNHEVFAGEELARLASGQYVLGGRNSWGLPWGVKGRCYWTEDHLNRSQETWAIKFANAKDDHLPPPLMAARFQDFWGPEWPHERRLTLSA